MRDLAELVGERMTKIVILGSCNFSPYEIIAVPTPISRTDIPHEEAARIAFVGFSMAIREADAIIVYAPDGIGEHTKRDINYAKSQGKKIFVTKELKE